MFRKSILALMAMVSILALSACKSSPATPENDVVDNTDRLSAEAAEQVMKDAFNKLADANSYEFDSTVLLNVLNAETPMSAELAVVGDGDMSTPTSPKLNLVVDGKVSMDGTTDMGGKLEVRVSDKMVYLYVSNLTNLDAFVPAEMAAMFTNQWWSIALPEDVTEALEQSQGDDAANAEDANKVKELIKNASFFTNISDESNSKGVYYLTADLDKEGTKAFIVEYANLMEESLTAEDLAELDEVLSSSTIKIDVSVDAETGELQRMIIDASVAVPEEATEGSATTVNMVVDTHYSNFNKVVTVEVPADAVPLQ